MDKGAHFYNCDFQVHTPRDLRWTGNDFGILPDELTTISEEQREKIKQDRIQFCKEYLQKIRTAGLNAVAITDHHDVVFAKLIRQVATEENREFVATSQIEKCITVFPGIELTLTTPACQCIIIFDSDFPDNDLDSVINFLGIHPANEILKKHSQIQRISQDLVNSLVNLHKRLDELGYCKGKFIILPNVNHNGQDTILRNGFNEHYCKMPCVGGYVDGAISTESGYVNKVCGGDPNYGNKPIGIISTSDNRFEDGRDLGKHSTWVKWEKPTAEALRQACLARESRLSQGTPELPQVYISRLEVTNSMFMSSFVVEFNMQYNAIIGGRGTGKSTILEYLRWVLCDQTELQLSDNRAEVDRRRHNFVEKTLIPFQGEVRVSFTLNSVTHIIKRNSVNNELTLKIGDNPFQSVKEEDVRAILSIQAYSQKQLSSVGVRTEELKRFIQQPIDDTLRGIAFRLSDISKKIRIAYSNLLRKTELQNEVAQFHLQIKSLNDQVLTLRSSLVGITGEDQKTIAQKRGYDQEENYIDLTNLELCSVVDKIENFISVLEKYPELLEVQTDIVNDKLIDQLNTAKQTYYQRIKDILQQLRVLVSDENQTEILNCIDEWKKQHALYQKQYEDAKQRATSSKNQLDEIVRIEEKLREINQNLTSRIEQLKNIGTPENEFSLLVDEWFTLHNQKLDLLSHQSQTLEALSEQAIKADYSNSLDVIRLKNQIVSAIQGSRIRDDKIQTIFEYIKEETKGSPVASINLWKELLEELSLLAETKVNEEKNIELPALRILDKCDFNNAQKNKLALFLTPEKWLEIALTEMEFSPEFLYSTNNAMGDTIPFADASAGQQATALITVLLNQPGNPLVIDQPEDDIDNRAIDDIIKSIWKAKKKRQIIFTSHNANIVVNGDAELVLCCDYVESGNQTRGKVKSEGAIDSKEIKEEITLVMEGGERAFRLRKEKYGF